MNKWWLKKVIKYVFPECFKIQNKFKYMDRKNPQVQLLPEIIERGRMNRFLRSHLRWLKSHSNFQSLHRDSPKSTDWIFFFFCPRREIQFIVGAGAKKLSWCVITWQFVSFPRQKCVCFVLFSRFYSHCFHICYTFNRLTNAKWLPELTSQFIGKQTREKIIRERRRNKTKCCVWGVMNSVQILSIKSRLFPLLPSFDKSIQ